MLRHVLVAVLAAVIFALLPPAPAKATDKDLLVVGVGAYDTGAFGGHNELAAGFHAEYRAGVSLWLVHPVIGIMATSDSAVYGYGGIVIDIPVSDRFYITPSFAAGGFDHGSGKNLGHTVEFRTGVEFSYEFDDASRVGVMFHHMSNADLGGKNPGSESVFVNYMVPISQFLR